MPFIQSVIKTNQLCLVVYNIEQEVISELSESGYPGFKDLQDVCLSCVLRDRGFYTFRLDSKNCNVI